MASPMPTMPMCSSSWFRRASEFALLGATCLALSAHAQDKVEPTAAVATAIATAPAPAASGAQDKGGFSNRWYL